jgi:Methyltransferase domain
MDARTGQPDRRTLRFVRNDVARTRCTGASRRARGCARPRGILSERTVLGDRLRTGTGNATDDLRAAFHEVISLDLSREMLARSSWKGRRIQADAAALPVRDRSVTLVALINMFLFPNEVARVLAVNGVLVWVSTNGDATPIYLSPADVLHSLPGVWAGVTSEAGWGTWLTARRANTIAED